MLDFNPIVTPAQRAQAYRVSAANKKPGEALELPDRVFDFELEGPTYPLGVRVVGEGPTKTILKCAEAWQKPQASAFTLTDGTWLENLTMESSCLPEEQSSVVGFSVESPKPRTATLKNVGVTGRSWGIYLWHGTGDTLNLENVAIRAANIGICAGKSSGTDAQFLNASGVRITIDPSLAKQGGAVTNPFDGGSIGVVVRGGLANLFDVTVNAIGQDVGRGPMCCAVSDGLGDPIKEPASSQTIINIYNLVSKLTAGPGTRPDCLVDIAQRYTGRVFVGGRGSGPGGELIRARLEKYAGK